MSSARRCCGLEFSKEVSRDLKLAGVACFELSEDDIVSRVLSSSLEVLRVLSSARKLSKEV